ncbi:iron ABC transporter permease [Cognatiyoonia sp. IB215446]|uniref:FecCD family ABC transporter permease n=1 Tax=Cognatiyoonia sp. IB215446 TaxID=3097355 RepID=UPI002A0CD840|nr:iron ABC transporter permease [Cognatiyoonia sp. IB215446]MDX8350431.1 iron ABC transporter permease [Cognatiyoonia sp. IB215446]
MNATRTIFAATGFWLCIAGVLFAFLWHISVGAKAIPLGTVWQALVAPEDGVFDHVVVRDLRMPRAIFAISVGAALSVAGALMQGVTRNPLAEPGILGLMAGATFAVIIGIGWFGLAGTAYVPLFAAIGALIGAVLVWTIASAAPGGATPLTLILSGAAVGGFLYAIESAAILLNEDAFRNFRVWLSGSLAGRDMETYLWALPWFITGLVAAMVIARQVTALAMGEETAAGLGVDTVKIKFISLAAVVVLTAAAVSVAGPLGFVGLVIPHVVRLFVGSDYRLIVPFSAIVGAGYVIVVDIAARVVLAPIEISTGIVTTMLGAPMFIWLVRTKL